MSEEVSAEAIEVAAKAYNKANFYHSWESLPEWARESHRDTARKMLEGREPT